MHSAFKTTKPSPVYFKDLLAVCFLAAGAWYLFFTQARIITLGFDSLQIVAAMQNFGIPSLPSTWFAGRPFLGLPWNLAAQWGGGSMAGYNLFQCWTLLLSSILVYTFVRLLTGEARFWAFAAAALKLAWAANPETFDNSGLAIYFVEMLFWLAITLWLAKAQGLLRGAAATAAAVVMTLCLVVVAGTYQTAWPGILLAPAGLILVLRSDWRRLLRMAAFVVRIERDIDWIRRVAFKTGNTDSDGTGAL